MDLLLKLGRDLLFVTAAAAALEMILPKSDIRRPLRFIFGLWFLALLLNPLITLVSETDLGEIGRSFGESDFSAAEESAAESGRSSIYREAGERLSAEIEAGLEAVFEEDFDVEAEIDEGGVVSLRVLTAAAAAAKETEIRRFLAERYGIPKGKIETHFGVGG